MPLIMWGFQGGFQYFMVSSIENTDTNRFEGDVFYVINNDQGNGSHRIGEDFISDLAQIRYDENSQIYGSVMEIVSEAHTFDELVEHVRLDEFSPLIYIPENFTECYNNFNATSFPEVFILSNPSDRSFGWALFMTSFGITNQEPYTIYNIDKQSELRIQTLTYEGEEDLADSFIVGFIGLLITILAVMAPVAFVSSSFAGEKEKHTLEGLLVLPIRRFDILIGKLTAGMSLIVIFSIMNTLGLLFYQWIVNQAAAQGANPLTDGITISTEMIIAVFLMVFLSSFIAIGFGIAIASLAKDTSSAEGTYMVTMMVPALIVGMTTMLSQLPTKLNALYLIPWTHSLAILYKSIYPQSYTNQTITGSLPLDIAFHLGYLMLFVFGSLFLASKVFDRESVVG